MTVVNRARLLAAVGAGIVTSTLPLAGATAASVPAAEPPANLGKPVKPPVSGPLRVAFAVGPETVLIDVAGPWEAFTDAMVPIQLYTVAPTMDNVDLGGIKARPDYTFHTAPRPHVIVIPATKALPETIAWIRSASAHAGVTMSVCMGAFVLAQTGLLDGLYATTHHLGYDELARRHPKIKVVRGTRFVETYDIATAGGETSGIDLALRVIERYFGPKAAATSADNMEYVRTQRRPWT